MLRVYLSILTCLALGAAINSQAATSLAAPSDADIRQILVNRIDVEKRSVGIVVGVIDAEGRRIVSYGSLEKGDPRPLDGDTLFEIGSITKVFTALLLADMAQRGEVKLDDPVAKYLPTTVNTPTHNGKQITLVDLATHTSGLPGMPGNFNPRDPANPYADYTVEQLYAFLSAYELSRDVGAKFEYSNLGFGLLGHALTLRAKSNYENLVRSRIAGPLGMKSTFITLPPKTTSRLAAGHSADLVTVPSWDLPTLAGAGALRSTANDMLTFLAANLDYTKTPLSAAMKSLLSVQRPTGTPLVNAALGWQVDTRGGAEIIWKNGGTGGYRTFIGYSPRSGIGVVALSNAATPTGVDDIGLHLLDGRFPLSVAAGGAREVSLDAKLLDQFVGHYEMASNMILTVSHDANQLFVQATGQPRVAVYAKNDHEFFYKVVDAQLSFETDTEHQASALVLHQNGHDMRAKRIDDAQAKQLAEAAAIRFKEQAPLPGGELMIRSLIDELKHDQVDYAKFTPEFAAIARDNESRSKAMTDKLGALLSVTFKGVDVAGADIYVVKHENGSVEWHLLMDQDGKISGTSIRPVK